MKSLFINLILVTAVFAQTGKTKISDYFDKIEEQKSFIAECEAEIREAQIKEFGRVLPKISGECEWSNNGCPVSLPMPEYPKIALRHEISGVIKVEILVNENGKVVYSKAVEGKKIFHRNAENAAAHSRFYPKTACGKTVLQKRIIVYNFYILQ